MKFKYDEKEAEKECVAYIDRAGDLRIKTAEDDSFVWCEDGGMVTGYNWAPSEATHKFYPGDKLTITF